MNPEAFSPFSVCTDKSIYPFRLKNALEGYIVPETFPQNSDGVNIVILLRNYGSDRTASIEILQDSQAVTNTSISLASGETKSVQIQVRWRGNSRLILKVDGDPMDELSLNAAASPNKAGDLVLVFHNHQPPNYTPGGVLLRPWALLHVIAPEVSPYGLGVYLHQAQVLKKHPDMRLTANLSPSLLDVWLKILNGELVTQRGAFSSNSAESTLIRETLNIYREDVRSRALEALTSLYAHTIAGFLVDEFELGDLVLRELEHGIAITKSALGIEPRGVWLPEMSFSMRLIPILSALDLEYTFLDGRFHYEGAKGDKQGLYAIYTVYDVVSGSSINVFFRDTDLSNELSFKANFCSDLQAVRAAYDFSSRLVDKSREGVLTVALDGENWVLFSQSPPLAALFFEYLVKYLTSAQRAEAVRLLRAEEALKTFEPAGTLYHIPSTSWLGSYKKWRGERAEHEAYWSKLLDRIRRLRSYVNHFGFDEKAKRAEQALWHALDSDYWWAEFWDPELIDSWLAEFDKLLPPQNQ